MADKIFFNQDECPAGSNQNLESNPFRLFDGWTAPEEYSCQLDQLLFPSCKVEQHDQQSDHELYNLPPGISELDQMIHGQVIRDEPVTEIHRNPDPDNVSGLFDLLGCDRNGRRKWDSCETSNVEVVEEGDSVVRLSTEELFRIAGARFIQSYSKSGDLGTNNPFKISFSGVLSDEELRNVELAEFLLTAAEKVGDGQFERAANLLIECDLRSSEAGDPVQRLVHYFSAALRERIYRQTGKVEPVEKQAESVHKIMNQPRECFLEFHEKVPFGQVTQFAAIQAVVDSVAKATRIHIVDFNIKKGEQWTIFMQALVSREENPVDILKITSIGTIDKDTLEETGQRLIDFAKAMALSFSYKIVMVEDLTELKENMFEIDYEEESVVVLSDYLFSTLISSVGKLDYVMKVILKMKPCVMVMTEVESNNNSPIFVNRFVDVLFYTSAFFDCLEACMERDNPHRMFVESTIFGEAIKMVVANEGEDRGIRSVKMDVWRAYFGRFGMEEADLSFSCVYQAELVAKKLPSWKFCTVEVVEKSLIVGWKGTPTHSVTAWNFNN
ncbi:DELLA protein GAI1 [Linum perenne]